MFFHLFNILASFQNNINQIFVQKLNIFVIIYQNKILINIKSLEPKYTKIIRYLF